MPGSFTKLLYHIVFSTKGRRSLIKPDLQSRIHEYMGGIVRGQGGVAIQIGGMPDHVHVLVRWRADESVSALLRVVKANSSKWIHETIPELETFGWQEGYSAFTVSESQIDTVRRYIANQEEHHRGRSFEEELTALLIAHGVEFEERYLLG